jgi:Zn-dependent protease
MDEKKKVYTSFHDIPVREYMYFPKGTVEVSKPGKFSTLEIKHILISILVLTIAFSFWNRGLIFNIDLNMIISSIPLAFAGVVTGFFFHELSHKFMAQKFGLWSEYRVYPMGLILSLIVSILTGFVFAAPGAVMFMGDSKYHETGKIAMAGPLANITVAFITFILFYYFFFESQFASLLGFICLINALLAAFNLLPLGPLDGIKIIKWNATVWILMLIASISILMAVLTKSPFVM